jgi:hypothetical protein
VVLEGTGAMTPFDIADDGRWIWSASTSSIAESELYRLDLATGRLTEINPTNGKVAYGDAELSPTAARSTSPRRGFDVLRLVRIDLATGRQTVLTPGLNWNVEAFDLSG